jgi:hypothetical protein
MTDETPKGDPVRQELEALTQEVWARALAGIPTTLGRLVHLASLRDASTGFYRDSRLVGHANAAERDLLLRQIHEEVFATWLSFSLEDQREELEQYLKTLKKQGSGKLATWLTTAPYLKLMPASAEAAERELYRSDLEIVLELLEDDLTES